MSEPRSRPTLRAALLLAALLLAGCAPPPPPEPDPLKVENAYLDAVRAENWAGALQRAWLPPRSTAPDEALARLKTTARYLNGGQLELRACEAKSDGAWALVVLRAEQPAAGGMVRALRPEWLWKKDGRWRVVAPSFLTEPALLELQDDAHARLAEWYRVDQEALTERCLRPPD